MKFLQQIPLELSLCHRFATNPQDSNQSLNNASIFAFSATVVYFVILQCQSMLNLNQTQLSKNTSIGSNFFLYILVQSDIMFDVFVSWIIQ